MKSLVYLFDRPILPFYNKGTKLSLVIIVLPILFNVYATASHSFCKLRVEIRCELKADGKFDGTIYTIRYFQHDGKGSLRMENGTVFQPNDRYLLENDKFRLYYTSASTETQTLTVVVEDNFGKSYEMEFSFNDTDEEEEFARSANKLGSV